MITTAEDKSYLSVNWQSPINYSHSLNQGLMGWWLIVPHWQGSVLRDLRGRHHGTLFNMEPEDWIRSDRPGGWGALLFDNGDSERADIPDNASLRFNTADFSMFVWVRDDVANTDGIMGKGGFAASDGWGYYVHATPGSPRFAMASDFSSNADTSIEGDGIWHHVGCRRVGDELTYWLDGKLDGTDATYFSGKSSLNGAAVFEIGRTGGGPGSWDGPLDDVRLYSRALHTAEIADLYDRSRSYQSGLLNRISVLSVMAPAVVAPCGLPVGQMMLVGAGK